MKSRYLSSAIETIAFSDHKMAFVSGPRQCGKTTLSKLLLRKRQEGSYHNWDDIAFRRIWAKDPKRVIKKNTNAVPLIIFDEIHKARLWKRSLKGVYDTLQFPVDILVTGSARLNIYKKGSDSLLGRYYPFRLHPFSLGELCNSKNPVEPADLLDAIFTGDQRISKSTLGTYEQLLRYGAFPEPFLQQNLKKSRLWRQNRVERVVREDLRDLSRIPELSRVEMLAALLPERVGSLLSLNALREDLEVNYNTVKRWLMALSDLYYVFLIKPYSKSIKRSLKKEAKLYLWDYSEVEPPGFRLENLVACHLLKACHYWTDTGEGVFELSYIRNKEKQEIDFLITWDGKPWLPVEVKSGTTTPSKVWNKFLPMLRCQRGIQIVAKKNIRKIHPVHGGDVLVASASDILNYLV